MIFVIMGMEVHPFDRLAKAVDELARAKALGANPKATAPGCRIASDPCRRPGTQPTSP